MEINLENEEFIKKFDIEMNNISTKFMGRTFSKTESKKIRSILDSYICRILESLSL